MIPPIRFNNAFLTSGKWNKEIIAEKGFSG
jgi:hypothetical protein